MIRIAVTPVICMVTDLRRCSGADDLLARIAAAGAAGVHLIQVREPHLEARALFDLVRAAVARLRGLRTRILVNDRLDIALAAGAHGVHLRGVSMSAARVRAGAPPGFLVGRSVHARDEAAQAASAGGLDYLIFGTVFPSASKPGHDGVGADALRDVVRAVPLPVLAIGGVTAQRVPAIISAGAAGFAAIRLFDTPGPVS